MARATIFHQLHDLGGAAWFGGTLANAVALNPASKSAGDQESAGAVANAGWDRWTPVNAAAIGAHLVGAAGLLRHDLGRVRAQQGVPTMAITKTALTAAALGVTGWARLLGSTVSDHGAVAAAGATEPSSATPPDVASAQRMLARLQWVIPALTGAIVATSAFAAEQYRPAEVGRGLLQRIAG
ncbi:hypothetical protein [uncultured Williamsia sp.]|uniref:hypothetical protein n=1 Tax=uncultured Williamsia sp. TaxID=259311 RepID=UPI002637C375|nr:hypothetical protein [uncultured Williamsia sp.]